jgi:hypothetical protein
MNKRFLEVSVKNASYLLGVTERSIINYIKDRRIVGTKVGKEWFVDRASIEAFALKYGFEINESPVAHQNQIEPNLEASINTPLHQIQKNEFLQEKVLTPFASQEGRNPIKIRQQKGVQNLRAFILLKNTLGCFPNCFSENNHFKEKLNQLSYSIIENLGSGFHAYEDQEKIWYYQKARAGLGALIAVSKLIINPTETEIKLFSEMEFVVLPAISSLIRVIESGDYKKTNRGKKGYTQ